MKKYFKSTIVASIFIVSGLLISGIGYYRFVFDNPLRFGALGDVPADSKESWLTYLLGFFLTIVGVLSGTIYREAMSIRSEGNHKISSYQVFFERIFKSTDLIMGLAASPIIFGMLIDAIAGISTAGMAVIALQNGFACSAIAGSLVHGGSKPAHEER
jgi:hypothetical protein